MSRTIIMADRHNKPNVNLKSILTPKLFSLYADLMKELAERGIIRSTNNPVADYAEYLVSSALHLKLKQKSTAGYDAVDNNKRRYEIKARRLTPKNKSTQLSAMRNLKQKKFDYLVGVRFREDFTVERAVVIRHATVRKIAKYNKHTNAWDLHLRDSVCCLRGVVDITDRIADVVRSAS